ncbi:MAG TPA: peptide-methionine (R)-S-oxide reductase [Nitrospinae bacterium]|nr:peptide-methionine (R)-S-oxide reductase [Nitrospinota bacterium]
MPPKITKTDEEWKKHLTREQYAVARMGGTEPAFSGKYNACKDEGTYICVCCGDPLFESDKKFDSGTGWPSFWEPGVAENVTEIEDVSHGMRRVEVACTSCGGHLGHVFPDGPPPTGLRYCINSASIALDRKG